MRRNVGGHADRDAAGAVDEQIWNSRRENDGLFARLIEVRNEVDGFFFEVGENIFGNFGEARFRIPHGRGRIAVDRTEITLAVHEHVTQVEVLRETNHRGIDDGFAMRVIVARRVAANFGAFAVAAIGG